MPAPTYRPAPRTDRPRRAPCTGSRDPNQAVVLREEDRPPGPDGKAPRTEPAAPPVLRRIPKNPVAGPTAGPKLHRNQAARRMTRSLAASGSIPRAVRSRVNAMSGSRACLFRRRAAGPKAYAAIGERRLLRHFRVPSLRVFRFIDGLKANVSIQRIFLCMKAVVPTFDAHFIHRIIHNAPRFPVLSAPHSTTGRVSSRI